MTPGPGRRRDGPVARRDRELFAIARMVDSAAAQVLMLGEVDELRDLPESADLETVGRELREISERLYSRTSDRRYQP